MKLNFKPKEATADERAGGCLAKSILWTVIALGAIFADVMFIALIRDALPGGIMGFGAIAGAFVTSLSIIGLVMGKTHFLRPGAQVWAAWGFFGIEVAVAILNVITAIQVARHQELGILYYWMAYGAPCTPFVPMIGWSLIAFLSPEREQAHKDMEMEDRMRKKEREYREAAHQAQIDVMNEQLEQFKGFLSDFTSSPENMQASREAAHRMGRQVLGNITGMSIASPGSSFIFQQQLPPAQQVTSHLVAMPKDSTDVPDDSAETEAKMWRMMAEMLEAQKRRQASPLAEMATAQEHPLPSKEHPYIQEVRDEIALNRQRDQQNGAK